MILIFLAFKICVMLMLLYILNLYFASMNKYSSGGNQSAKNQ